MKAKLATAITAVILFLIPNLNFGQSPPPLGATSSFALFTAGGAFNNIGAGTVVTGDAGTNAGAFNAFPPGIIVGNIYLPGNPIAAQAAVDVALAYGNLSTVTCGPVIGVTMGSGQTLLPNVYCTGAASTINGDLILDGGGDPTSLFIFKIGGALSTTVNSRVILTNSASICNVYWQVNGAVELGNNSTFRGTIVANGAISLLNGARLFGRGLSQAGAISLQNNIVTVGLQATASTITALGATTFCQGSNVVLTGNSGGRWNTGATTESITVTTGGDYFVRNTGGSCGTVTSNHIIVTVNPLPNCTITGDGSICLGESTELCAPSGTGNTYLWSTGAITNCITVSTAGTYSVTVTNASGCSRTCSKTVTTAAPACTITGNSSICQGGSTSLCAPSGTGYTYLWSTGATTKCITVSAAATYSVTVKTAGGCISTCSKTVTITSGSTCTITGSNIICQGGSTSLCAPSGTGYTYLWSTGATSRCITVSTAGTYSVTVSIAGGCVSTCSMTVTVSPKPSCTITGDGSICQGQSTQLCAPSGTGYTYLWSTGATTQCITVSAAGNYYVTVKNTGGCSSTCSKTVTVGPAQSCTITGNSSLCQGQSTQLCAPAGCATYLWSNGATTRCITVSKAGTYSVTITTAGEGCSSTCSKTVTVSPKPSCTITGNTSICPGQSTQLCAPSGSGYTYLWSTGATSRCITVNCAGTYTVKVTNSSGCYSTCDVCVTYTKTNSTSRVASVEDKNQSDDGSIKANAYPNPFNSKAIIEFQNTESNSHVLIELYSSTGNKITTLFNREVKQGELHKVEVNAGNLTSGVYIYRIVNGDQIIVRKLVLLR